MVGNTRTGSYVLQNVRIIRGKSFPLVYSVVFMDTGEQTVLKKVLFDSLTLFSAIFKVLPSVGTVSHSYCWFTCLLLMLGLFYTCYEEIGLQSDFT